MSLSEALPTTATDIASEFTHRRARGNCKWRTCPRSLRGGWSGIRIRSKGIDSTNVPPRFTLH